MRVTLESTDKIVTVVINGQEVPARVWQGETAGGVACHAYITRIAVANLLDATEFERDLRAQAPMRADVQALPDRLVELRFKGKPIVFGGTG